MAKASKAALDIQKEISRLRKVDDHGQWLQSAFQRIEDAVNNLGRNTAAAPKGILPPPPPIQQVTVKTNGNGLVHAVIGDENPIEKGLHYFLEYDTTPDVTQPHVVHLGASRTMNPIALPALDDDGIPQQFYFRGYSQYPGGRPGTPIHFGGETPAPVAPGGTQQMTLIPSTGSGTAQNSGQQGGSGFGKVLARPQGGPKRAIKQ
jgi:hypothetical protein